jgi:hypothetical protein
MNKNSSKTTAPQILPEIGTAFVVAVEYAESKGLDATKIRIVADHAFIGKNAFVIDEFGTKIFAKHVIPSIDPVEIIEDAPKIKSAHADCTHPKTKSARAKCRRERKSS